MALYTQELFRYQRRVTREVRVGDVGIGGKNPIRIQSMTISDTKDTEAVVAETRQLVEAGCEIVRITAPTIHHAENLAEIRRRLRAEGIRVPLVADIHFTPQAAMIAADHVEKVRINPGNYADRKLFAVKEYTDAEYQLELEHMAEKFLPLVRKCKANGVAMRIGTNHGSLSDRIMNRYGDTPEGMVESALEFVRLCEMENYDQIVLSMKASSPFVMIAAYRLLAQRMAELGMDYPFHLGVTEAGEGEDGRIKSSVGIGSLLWDGIGDTLRVSLTEDSIHEIPVARELAAPFQANRVAALGVPFSCSEIRLPWNPAHRERRSSREVSCANYRVGASQPLAVAWRYSLKQGGVDDLLNFLRTAQEIEKRGERLTLAEAPSFEEALELFHKIKALRPELAVALECSLGQEARRALEHFDGVVFRVGADTGNDILKRLGERLRLTDKFLELRFVSAHRTPETLSVLQDLPLVTVSLDSTQPLYDYRALVCQLREANLELPVHLYVRAGLWQQPTLLGASVLGGLLVDGIGDGVEVGELPPVEAIAMGFNVLQATRLRISKAEFIACPSCGRTLFDLQETTQRIKSQTGHLKGVKIAIMGCIVNGPGEMADADFGYVGGGPGKIHLYVGKDCVEKNIPTALADQKLIELIKSHHRWVEPPESLS